MARQIFINYRRKDAIFQAKKLYDELMKTFPNDVFWDIDTIPGASQWGTFIEQQLLDCSLLICLVGPNWNPSTSADGTTRKLDDKGDWVRRELEVALANQFTKVMPIVLELGELPSREWLPPSIAGIHERNIVHWKVLDDQFIERLTGRIKAILDEVSRERAQDKIEKKSRRLLKGQAFIDGGSELFFPMMRVVSSGSFMMGSRKGDKGARSSELPQHEVGIYNNFGLSILPITVSQWNFAVQNGLQKKSINERLIRNSEITAASGIGWDDATSYCAWLTAVSGRQYRLPSEAEWEYACRSDGEGEPFSTGRSINGDLAQFNVKYQYRHIKRFKNPLNWPSDRPRPMLPKFTFTNRFKVAAMHGFVWEWVRDCWNPDYETGPFDQEPRLSEPESDLKVVRGGSFASSVNDLRSARRGSSSRTPKQPEKFGFRVACDL